MTMYMLETVQLANGQLQKLVWQTTIECKRHADIQAHRAHARQKQNDGLKGKARVSWLAGSVPVMLFGYGVSKLRCTA
jgi:hypothetical protein